MTIRRHINCDFCNEEAVLPDIGLEGWGRIEGMVIKDTDINMTLEHPTACPKCFKSIVKHCIALKTQMEA